MIIRKTIISLMAAMPLVSATYAQNSGSVRATLIDESGQIPIVGAIVQINSQTDSLKKIQLLTSDKGTFSHTVPYGKYDMIISFIGNETIKQQINVDKPIVQLGKLVMKQESKKIDDVVIKAVALRSSQKGDTLVYNADAFKVAKDANTEDILQKMPGITIQNGKVEAHGEDVKKVLVDGKEYFGSDVTSAIKNMPAEAISKIEVYNKLSDKAEFSGIDDGEGYKAINIVTNAGMRNGKFGKFQAGYGDGGKYTVGASINMFKGNSRISLIGMANNINQQNFATDDILGVVGTSSGGGSRGGRGGGGRSSGTSDFMVGNQDGISKVKSIGVNYTTQWGEKVKFNGSYFFNTTNNFTTTLTDRQYFLGQDSLQLYNASSSSTSRNYNHRFNARLDYRINENNNIMFRPSATFQSNFSDKASESYSNLQAGDAIGSLINDFISSTKADNTGYNIGTGIVYMHKFGTKAGRTLTAEVTGNISNNDRDNLQYSLTRYYNPNSEKELNQSIITNSNSYRIGGTISYAEPVSTKAQILINYNANYNKSDIDKRSYLLPDYDFEETLSNTYNSGYFTQRIGPGFRYNDDKAMFVMNINYQASTLANDQTYPVIANPKLSANFDNLVYFGMLHYKFTPNRSLRTMLRSSTNNPSVTQLQDVLDISNPLFISQGNPKLKPTYTHSLFMNYTNANVRRGQTFIAMIGGQTQSNSIANSVYIAEKNGVNITDDNGNTIVTLNKGAQYSKPINMNDYWSINGMLSFGTPITLIKSNINFNARYAYTNNPSMLNNRKSITQTHSYTGGAVLSSNINENIDFTFSYDMGYNVAKNSIQTQKNNTYLNQVARGRIKWVTWKGITLQADAAYRSYRGITDDFSEEYLICNALIGKKIFKNQRGEVNFGVNDIFNQNKSFSRNVTASYIENVTTNVIGRYFGVYFTYNLRAFKGKGTSSVPSSLGSGSGNRPAGMPPRPEGGFGGGGGHMH